MDDVVSEFLVESYENLDRLDSEFVALEEDPEGAAETLQSIFRTIHTIKGTCGFLGFGRLEKVAHVGENLLSKLRDGVLDVNQEITTALLSLVDAVRTMLSEIEASGAEGDEEYASLIATLSALQEETRQEAAQDAVATVSEQTAGTPEAEGAAIHSDGGAAAGPQPAQPGVPQAAPEAAQATAEPQAKEAKKSAARARTSHASESTIRVDVDLLDKLMTLVGELVLSRNQVLQYTQDTEDSALQAASQRLNLITSELQEGVMKTRMQPISAVWNKFPRVVRDLSLQCDKKIRLEMEGKETELDKTLIEAIKDPLTHIVRNSVDHGIEAPSERKALGKPEEGVLLLRAFHEGGQVVMEITDDGGGINPEKVRNKAIERGLITQEQATRMSERDLVSLIMRPGFSTAEKVTNVSGRGVGMDVVKTNIEKIGGAIEVLSEAGKGSTMRIKIPLTLAIIPALLVTTVGKRYAIPQAGLLELVRLDKETALRHVEDVNGAPFYRLRGRILPLVYLQELLGIPAPTLEERETPINIVVLQADGRRFGLIVDMVNDSEEIVVKPLSKHLGSLAVYSGATIMGDGSVALILDILGLAKSGGLLGSEEEPISQEDTDDLSHVLSAGEGHLLVTTDGHCRIGIPLFKVSRLEELETSKIELSGDYHVVQYRGGIMPIVYVDQLLGFPSAPDAEGNELLQVVVFTHHGVSIGLAVGEILDIVGDQIEICSESSRFGVESSAVLQGRVTEILAVDDVLEAILSTFQPAALAA